MLMGLAVGFVPTGASAGGHIMEELLSRPDVLSRVQAWSRDNQDDKVERCLMEALRFLRRWRQHVDVGLRHVAEVIVDGDRAAKEADAQPGDDSGGSMCVGVAGIRGERLIEVCDGLGVIEVIGGVERAPYQLLRLRVGVCARRTHQRDKPKTRHARPPTLHSSSSVPAPVSSARRKTRSADTTSSTAIPRDLKIVISLSLVRPGTRPSTTSPSSPTT